MSTSAALDFHPVLNEFGASEGVQEFLFDSFLQTEIPGSLKYGTFVGEVRLYTIHAIRILYTPSDRPEDRRPLRQVRIADCRSLVMRSVAIWASVTDEAALL